MLALHGDGDREVEVGEQADRGPAVPGPLLYGAFAAKVLLVHSRRLPGWAMPLAGGTLAIVIGVLWYTSALWYYSGYQLPAF